MDSLFTNQTLSNYVLIWTQMKQGEPLTDDEETIADVMRHHPEFDPFWTEGEAAFHPQEIDNYVVSPLIHTGLHVVIENQLINKTPEEVAPTLNALLQKGLSRHEAMHQIIAIWGDLYYRGVRQGEDLYEWEYIELLNGLVRAA